MHEILDALFKVHFIATVKKFETENIIACELCSYVKRSRIHLDIKLVIWKED